MNHSVPPDVTEIDQLTVLLNYIGAAKSILSIAQRGILNTTGLYVQMDSRGQYWKLKAGGKFKTYFEIESPATTARDATELDLATPWNLTKYDRSTWNNRFAKLVWPTTELAYLVIWAIKLQSEPGRLAIEKSVSNFQESGQWTTIATESCNNCSTRLELWHQWAESCYQCGVTQTGGPLNKAHTK